MWPTIIIGLVLAAAIAAAIRYVSKKGTCAGCAEKGKCSCGCSSASSNDHNKHEGCSSCGH